MFIRRFKSALFALFALLLCLGNGETLSALAQPATFFDHTQLERRLQRQFKLTNADMRRLRPLIEKESTDVARSYLYHSGAKHRDNFLSLWDNIRSSRVQFEAGLPDSLTVRQKKALHAARTEAETHIMYLWLDDYVGTLTSVLQLDRFQLASTQSFLEKETEKRLRLIRETDRNGEIDSDWQKLTDEREKYLKGILDVDQFRDYLLLGTAEDEIIAQITCPDGFRSTAGTRAI
jgi:hypothetical protein